jgi:hypothetical protein
METKEKTPVKSKSLIKPKKLPELSILDKVRNDPKYSTVRSVDWFRKKIRELGGDSPSAKYELLKTTKDIQTTRVLPGTMYIFKYAPKHADTLDYYDMWPCTLMFGLTDTGMIGINFHYLPIQVRAKLFDKLRAITNTKNSKEQVLKITWKFLSNVSKFPEVRPAVKQYLYSHIQSKLIRVPVDDWYTALLLPIESFAKKSQSYVARDSMSKMRKRTTRR